MSPKQWPDWQGRGRKISHKKPRRLGPYPLGATPGQNGRRLQCPRKALHPLSLSRWPLKPEWLPNNSRRMALLLRSPTGRHLPTRELHSIVWVKNFDFRAQASWEQFICSDTQRCCHNEKFQIGNAAVLGFHSSHGFPADVPPENLQPHGKLILRPALSLAEFTNLRPDYIQFGRVCSDAVYRIKTTPAIL